MPRCRNALTRLPLTPEQQELALTMERLLLWEIQRVPSWFYQAAGRPFLKQEAWLAVCKAAADYDPVKYADVPFRAFALNGIRKHLLGVRENWRKRQGVWSSGYVASVEQYERHLDDSGRLDHTFTALPDYRRTETNPLLKAWCSPDYSEQRRALPMRWRVILYLRFVECMTYRETAAALGMNQERVRQLQHKATTKMSRFRGLDRSARRLAVGDRT